MLVIFPITPSNPHTITTFTTHCGCSNAITYIKICCKYFGHISHYTFLQILTQLQHSQQTVAAVMQLHILKYVDTGHVFYFQTFLQKQLLRKSNTFSDSLTLIASCNKH